MKTTTAIETRREGNTFYAFADSGEMIASAPGKNSLANEIGWRCPSQSVSVRFGLLRSF